MSDYVIQVKTDADMGHRIAEGFLKGWLAELPAALHPDRFDKGEPIRKIFDENRVDDAIALWRAINKPIYLKRVKQPKFQSSGSWRIEKGLDERPFPWHFSVWLDSRAGDEQAVELFRFLIRQLRPAFGSVTTYDDKRRKHFSRVETSSGIVEKYEGLEVGDTLPGVYWLTYLGAWSLQKLRFDSHALAQSIPAFDTEIIEGGSLIRAYQSSSCAGTVVAEEHERKLRRFLGAKHFFCKT